MRAKAPETYNERLVRLRELRYEAIRAGSEQAVANQHERGKYTARKRIENFLDPGSFQELDVFVRHPTYQFDMQENRPDGDALVTGNANGRRVCVFSQDFTVFRGSLGDLARRSCRHWSGSRWIGRSTPAALGVADFRRERYHRVCRALGACGESALGSQWPACRTGNRSATLEVSRGVSGCACHRGALGCCPGQKLVGRRRL
jgi:propionyl-CoA carboxylase beta chain